MHFYANSGVCIFKFLVTPDDPQKEFSTIIMVINLCCFLLIAVNYTIIFINTKRSSKCAVNCNNNSSRMEAKITLIILTDFICWIPLTVVCFLHFGELIDATHWYPYFSSILLPLNSVINPMIYNRKIEKILLYPVSFVINTSQRKIGSLIARISLSFERRRGSGNPENDLDVLDEGERPGEIVESRL